jgi:hypothetical protein
MADHEHIDDGLASELTQLVDGQLSDDRREALQERIAASPELADRVREQRAVAARLTAAAEGVGAPARLRARVEAGRRPARRRALAWTGALGASVAAAVLALALVLPAGTPAAPSLAQAASVGTLPPNQGAPPPASPTLLAKEQDGVPFPRWGHQFGWVAFGARESKVKGREASTVYYHNPKTDRSAAYTILGGNALDPPKGAPHRTIKGTTFYLAPANGKRVVTWDRGGHTCILQGTAPPPKLFELASWRGNNTIPF